jgi:hypothetical protein
MPAQGEGGSAAGTAAIAAASLPIAAAGMFDEGGDNGAPQDQLGFGGQDAFGDAPLDDGEGSRSYYSGDEHRTCCARLQTSLIDSVMLSLVGVDTLTTIATMVNNNNVITQHCC